MPLVEVELPSPLAMRAGWAAMAALHHAYGWVGSIYATEDLWFNDASGNWAAIRFLQPDRAVLFGHDHEFSETYFRQAAKDFGHDETDLLKDAPDWWESAIDPAPSGPYIGFIYGWDGNKWQRADYTENDGFKKLGLLDSIQVHSLSETIDVFELPVNQKGIEALYAADGAITAELLTAVMPGSNIQLGVDAANRFLLADIQN